MHTCYLEKGRCEKLFLLPFFVGAIYEGCLAHSRYELCNMQCSVYVECFDAVVLTSIKAPALYKCVTFSVEDL